MQERLCISLCSFLQSVFCSSVSLMDMWSSDSCQSPKTQEEHLKLQCARAHTHTHTKMISTTSAAVFKPSHQKQVWLVVKEEDASWWQHSNGFQTRSQPATRQDRHYNTEKSTRLPWTCTNAHPLIISAHTTFVCFMGDQREQREGLSLFTPFKSVCIISASASVPCNVLCI